MSLHTKKLEIIESILKVEEEAILYEVKSLLSNKSPKTKTAEISDSDLASLLKTSEKDYKNGKFTKQSDLRKQVKTWRKK